MLQDQRRLRQIMLQPSSNTTRLGRKTNLNPKSSTILTENRKPLAALQLLSGGPFEARMAHFFWLS